MSIPTLGSPILYQATQGGLAPVDAAQAYAQMNQYGEQHQDDGSGGADGSQKRKRKTKACDACHAVKAKCLGDHPCMRCNQLNQACTYERPSERRGPKLGSVHSRKASSADPEAPPPPKKASRKKKFDPTVYDAAAGFDAFAMQQHYGAMAYGQPWNAFPAQNLGGNSAGEEDQAGAYHQHPGGAVSIPRPSRNHPRATSGNSTAAAGHPDEFSAASIITGLSRSTSDVGFPHGNGGHFGPALLPALPHPTLIPHLVTAFFGRMNESLPVLHRPHFERIMTSYLSHPTPHPPAILAAVSALGAFLLHRHPEVASASPETSGQWVLMVPPLTALSAKLAADEVVGQGFATGRGGELRRVGENPGRYTVSSLSITAALLMSSASTLDEWELYVGLAQQVAKKIGLNREPQSTDNESNDSWIEKEEGRRIWWQMFLDYAILPVWNNRPPVVNEEDCDLSLPCPDALYADPIHPPPAPIPFKQAFALLSPLPIAASTPSSNITPQSNSRRGSGSGASSTSSPRTHPPTPAPGETLRSLLHSGRTGISGYAALLQAIGARITRLRWTRATFSDTQSAEAWERTEKGLIAGMLDRWYEALPESVTRADVVAEGAAVGKSGKGQEKGGVEPRGIVLLISYHTYEVLLFGRWHPLAMVYDDEWLMSNDFLTCVEHADRLTHLLELLVSLDHSGSGVPGSSGQGKVVLDLMRWASPYVFGVSVTMAGFVHSAVLRKLRLMNQDANSPSANDPTEAAKVAVLEKALVQKIELREYSTVFPVTKL
ncbi:hypothetical protein M427DRAFT_296859 [Gonapodya prolifera JEL478]|uniref:Zn(2)-C6 fungal-type domain-containing protein n=1 Tax=Gonapodya prolifera (strain JEL478) TaxID=1344416 RepID=A0A139AHZ3_GONPJ|nr:hypothetical protein M427DRAFT_296859 [Gonapodya prolifera JEL478]|eukprot:KXS16380.1 hypothetical protein M427DRAFT_296859 [Gonapodya prolifera JEL478]